MRKRQKGYILVTTMLVSVLVLVIGLSGMYISQMGNRTVSDQKVYHKLNLLADQALNEAVDTIVNAGAVDPCIASVTNKNGNEKNYKYSYSSFSDSANKNCLVYAYSYFISADNAKVVKTTVIPVGVTNSGDANTGALNSSEIDNVNWNGSQAAVGSTCGPGLATKKFGQNINLAKLEPKIIGDPKTQVIPQDTNLYKSVFQEDVDNWSKVKNKVDTIIADKMNSLSLTEKLLCAVDPTPSNIQNTNCVGDKSQGKVVIKCTGSVNKTIDPALCPKIVLNIGSLEIKEDIIWSELTVNTSNNLHITKSVKGFFASDNILNLNLKGNEVIEGVFIGGGSSNLSLGQSGTPIINGLVFIGGDPPPPNQPLPQYNINLSGNTDFNGAIVVDGKLNNFERNGGGNKSPNIEYDPDVLNNWQEKYPTLMKPATCGGGVVSLPKNAYLNKTKMTMY